MPLHFDASMSSQIDLGFENDPSTDGELFSLNWNDLVPNYGDHGFLSSLPDSNTSLNLARPQNHDQLIISPRTQPTSLTVSQLGLCQRVREVRRTYVLTPHRSVPVRGVVDYFPPQIIPEDLPLTEVSVTEILTTQLIIATATRERIFFPRSDENHMIQGQRSFQSQSMPLSNEVNMISFTSQEEPISGPHSETSGRNPRPIFIHHSESSGGNPSPIFINHHSETSGGNPSPIFINHHSETSGGNPNPIFINHHSETSGGNPSLIFNHHSETSGGNPGPIFNQLQDHDVPDHLGLGSHLQTQRATSISPGLYINPLSNRANGLLLIDDGEPMETKYQNSTDQNQPQRNTTLHNLHFMNEFTSSLSRDSNPIKINSSDDEDETEGRGLTRSLPCQKYGPYICPRCKEVFNTAQFFAAHMSSHYSYETRDERRRRQAAKYKKKRSSLRLVQMGSGVTVLPESYNAPRIRMRRNGRMRGQIDIRVEDQKGNGAEEQDKAERQEQGLPPGLPSEEGWIDVEIKEEPLGPWLE